MNLILIDPAELSSDQTVALTGERAAHILQTLRAAIGDTIRIGLLNGPRGTGALIAMTDTSVALRCEFESSAPPRPRVDLLLALPRPKVMKRLWAQLAALGVGRIILTNAARVERNYFDSHVIDAAFFRPLLVEGLQQAQDTRLPDVHILRRFKPLIEDELDTLTDAETRLVAHPYADEHAAAGVLAQSDSRVLLAIGPEGGWVPFELELLQAHGFRPINFGPRTLRTDTACIAALAVVSGLRI